MTQEEKSLLLQDLCARLPYEVNIQVKEWTVLDTELKIGHINRLQNDDIELKPYLRPMSSMTEEEKLHMELKFHFSYNDGVLDNVHIFETGGTYDRDGNYEPPTTYREIREVNMDLILEFIHWLNKKMFDYRKDDEGKTMIEKGLAIEAPEGMYKNY